MTLVKADKDYEAGVPPSDELAAAIGRLAEEMARVGVMLEMGGLLPRGRAHPGDRREVDRDRRPIRRGQGAGGGLRHPSGEVEEEAIELAKRFMRVHVEVLGSSYEGECEVRQLFDPADFA
jgi:hypothetical protein